MFANLFIAKNNPFVNHLKKTHLRNINDQSRIDGTFSVCTKISTYK